MSLTTLDNIAVSIIAEFLPFKDYPSLRKVVRPSIDDRILAHDMRTIPRTQTYDFFNSFVHTDVTVWEFIAALISRKIYIGTLSRDHICCECMSSGMIKTINKTFTSAIKSNMTEWFLANCHSTFIYNHSIPDHIIRLVPVEVTSKYIHDMPTLARIYKTIMSVDAIYAAHMRAVVVYDSDSEADGDDEKEMFALLNVIDVQEKYPLTFQVIIDLAMAKKYYDKMPNSCHNIRHAVISHLHKTADVVMNDTIECRYPKNISAICEIIDNTYDDTFDCQQLYIIALVAARLKVTIPNHYTSIFLSRCIELSDDDERLVVSMFVSQVINVRYRDETIIYLQRYPDMAKSDLFKDF